MSPEFAYVMEELMVEHRRADKKRYVEQILETIIMTGRVRQFIAAMAHLIQDLAIQCVHVTNSSALYRLRPEARSRLTAGYMTCYFIGGAAGSALGTQAWTRYGWNGVCAVGIALALAALLAMPRASGRR